LSEPIFGARVTAAPVWVEVEEDEMEDFVEGLTRGNVTEVKVVLASIVALLAAYQVFLMGVTYGRIRLPFLGSGPAAFTHRATGDAIVAITLLIAFMCVSYFGFEDVSGDDLRAAIHVAAGSTLLAVLGLKIVVVRWWHRMGRYLPQLGATVFTLFAITWLTSAADYLWG
jgi:hypothetical protein